LTVDHLSVRRFCRPELGSWRLLSGVVGGCVRLGGLSGDWVHDTPVDQHIVWWCELREIARGIYIDVVARYDRAGCAVVSHECVLDDLAVFSEDSLSLRSGLRLGPDWTRRWSATFHVGPDKVAVPVRDMPVRPPVGCVPVRRFSWSTRQRHRPGLQFMVSTGRHHGFESLAEQRLLLALDFAGVADVLAQPFELRFTTVDGVARHVPDFLVIGRDGVWLVNVRPQGRVKDEDRLRFAAAAEVAAMVGWRAVVVSGWRPGVLAALDALSAQRRTLQDPLGLQAQLLAAVGDGPVAFGDLVAATCLPVVARAHALHLIWHRRLSIDLAAVLGDRSAVWPVPAGGDR
jgi:hypothetical protein